MAFPIRVATTLFCTAFLCMLPVPASGETVLIDEHFNGSSYPSDWILRAGSAHVAGGVLTLEDGCLQLPGTFSRSNGYRVEVYFSLEHDYDSLSVYSLATNVDSHCVLIDGYEHYASVAKWWMDAQLAERNGGVQTLLGNIQRDRSEFSSPMIADVLPDGALRTTINGSEQINGTSSTFSEGQLILNTSHAIQIDRIRVLVDTVGASPLVSVEVPDPNASESPLDYGTFTIRRTGATTSPLQVNVQWGGSASAGSDYQALETVANIPAGSATLNFTVIPINDSAVEGDESVNLTVAAGAGYTPGSPSTGTVIIKSDDQGASAITLSGPSSGPILSPLEFSATATNCTPNPAGWTWTIDNQVAPLQYGGIYTSVAALGLATEGNHTVRATNSGCPGAQGSLRVNGQPHEKQTFTLRSFDGVDPSRATIVLVHGLQNDSTDWDDLWTCMGDCDSGNVAFSIGSLLSSVPSNKLQFQWSGAFQGNGAADLVYGRRNYTAARANAEEAGIALAGMLRNSLGPSYNNKIQFIGHSLGTVVGANAAAWYLTQTTGVREAQFTALDRPDRVSKIPPYGGGERFEADFGFDSSFFAATLAPAMRAGLTFKLDNYWALDDAGVGGEAQGFPSAKVYNHRRPASCPGCEANYDDGLEEPNDVGGAYFEAESDFLGADNNHTGVQQWYRWTMQPNLVNPGTCNGASWSKPTTFHGSLNPCQNGFSWSILGPSPASFPSTVEPDTAAVTTQPVSGSASYVLSGDLESEALALEIVDNVAAADADIVLPDGATAMSFLLTPSSVNPNDTIVVLLGDIVVWSASVSTLPQGVGTRVGPVPLRGLRGTQRLALRAYGGGNTHLTLTEITAVNVIPPCALSDTLCITSQRFRVEADWEDHQGNSGDAVPRYVGTNDSGFFWFFGDANLELVVKVLNACTFPGAPRFWVYAAGLTDVGVRLKITDTWTGATRTYSNPRGTPFQPIQDTDAFSTCSAPPAIVAPGTGVLLTGAEAESYIAMGALGAPAEESIGTEPEVLADAPREDGVIDNTLTLNNERFAIDVTWRTATGQSGVGHPVALTNDSGYFWFFASSNIELVIKVLDACGFPGAPRFWVYAGGLTNVEATITVRDTQTGSTKTYTNPLGTAFQPIVDVDAFATCGGGGGGGGAVHSVTVSDPREDVRRADITSVTVQATEGGSIVFEVTFGDELWDECCDHAHFFLDTDENGATGQPNPVYFDGSVDPAPVGADYWFSMHMPGFGQWSVWRWDQPTSAWTPLLQLSDVAISTTGTTRRMEFPLSVLADDGRLRFKIRGENPGWSSYPRDYVPDWGDAPAQTH